MCVKVIASHRWDVFWDMAHVDGDVAPPKKGAQPLPPNFRSMSILAKRSSISATAELLF